MRTPLYDVTARRKTVSITLNSDIARYRDDITRALGWPFFGI